MSVLLHQECKERLVEIIAEQLRKITVQNGNILEWPSAIGLLEAEPILPQTGPLRTRLIDYVGETPVFNFLCDSLSRELDENQKYDSEKPTMMLSDLEEYKDTVSIAKRLVEDFDSLPWEYTLSIKLENELGDLINQLLKNQSQDKYLLSDSLALIVPDDDFIEKYPLQSGIKARDDALSFESGGLFPILTPLKWEEKLAYLQVKANGFIGKYMSTVPRDNAIDFFKAFCGIAIALRLLRVSHTYRSTPLKAKFFIHRNIDNAWVIQGVDQLETNEAEAFVNLVFDDLNGRLNSEDKKVDWMQKQLELVRCIFSNQEKSYKLIHGGQWLFDSYCGRNELLSFVQTTVVLEILLGEKAVSDLMGLGELLRNRCAYLIGKSHEQRKKILDEFKGIYDVRSSIVHRGKNRLDLHERALFSKLQWMCRRVIQEEVNLLQEDLKKDAK